MRGARSARAVRGARCAVRGARCAKRRARGSVRCACAPFAHALSRERAVCANTLFVDALSCLSFARGRGGEQWGLEVGQGKRAGKPWGKAVGESRGERQWGTAVGENRGQQPWAKNREIQGWARQARRFVTVAILAQGTHWAVATSQAFFVFGCSLVWFARTCACFSEDCALVATKQRGNTQNCVETLQREAGSKPGLCKPSAMCDAACLHLTVLA